MATASRQYTDIGAHTYAPEGPFLNAYAGPSFGYGDVVQGNAGSEFIFVKYCPIAAVTWNQGDVFVWDSTFMAVPAKLGAGYHPFGANVGTIFFNARVGDPASVSGKGLSWSYSFQPGSYGIWVQRAGAGVVNFTTITAQADLAYTTATVGSVSALASGATNSETIQALYSAPLSFTFTATTVSGSATLTVLSDTNKLETGMVLSGTGVPNGAYIVSIDGGQGIVMSAVATASGSAVTITAKKGTFWGTTVSGSPIITGVSSLPGIFPNATVTGTGVAGTILSITGTSPNFVVTISANASATGTVSIAATQYVEGFLSWPYISAQN